MGGLSDALIRAALLTETLDQAAAWTAAELQARCLAAARLPARTASPEEAVLMLGTRTDASVRTIIIVIFIPPTGSSIGYRGRIAADLFITPGALIAHLAISGRTITASSSSSASAAAGPATRTDAITGMDGIPMDGMGTVLPNM